MFESKSEKLTIALSKIISSLIGRRDFGDGNIHGIKSIEATYKILKVANTNTFDYQEIVPDIKITFE